ncbi:MAG TPA: DUF5074 domain-containing protein [Bacteroidia bacterium]|nr:DUF5074 domain-containing protein [Bacteroidia bacterium]
MRVIWAISICFVFSLFTACEKDKSDPAPVPIEEPLADSSNSVFVINEGNYTSGNASITLYNKKTGALTEDLFRQQNNQSLGDVAQSMSKIGDRYYIVVNNSGRLVVCDHEFKKLAQIPGLISPRYLLKVAENKAYLSDYKSGYMHVIDLPNAAQSTTFTCPGWTEEMLLCKNEVFVYNPFRNYLYVIDALMDQLKDSIMVGKNASGMCMDKNGKVWVMSSGDPVSGPPKLSRINPADHSLELVLPFSSSRNPFKLCINGKKDTLYFTDKDIYRMSVNDASLPQLAFIPAAGRSFYGMGIDPKTSDIYLSDALDYIQRSQILVYNARGEKKTEFKAGINANGFYFE